MMDYYGKETTFNRCEEREEVKDISIKTNVQETYSILLEMECELEDFAHIINGQSLEEKGLTSSKDASCLAEEAGLMVRLAYKNLNKLKEIKKVIV